MIYKLINSASTLCPEVPVSAKIRVFDDEEKTIEYAKMIEGAGAKVRMLSTNMTVVVKPPIRC